MTRYTVIWNEVATDELADLWLTADDRDAVSFATNTIDQELCVDAAVRGEHLHEGLRVLLVPPLKVIFSVREEDRVVEISNVRRS